MSWDSLSDLASNVFGDGGAFSFGSTLSSGNPIGTYFWAKQFKELLFSYNEVSMNERNWKLNPGYSFKVVSRKSAQPNGFFGEFRLPINPSNLQQNEEFATSFRPTQNGMVVEHSGAIFKEIVISGTTGIGVNDARARQDEITASKGSLTDAVQTVGNLLTEEGITGFLTSGINALGKPRRGYTWAHLLRNYIRAYAQGKTTSEGTGWALVFCNKKDGEEWQVEPVSIDINRAANRSFLYDYRIVLRGIRRNIPEASDNLFSDVLGFINDFENMVDNALTLLDGASNLMDQASSIIFQIESAATTTLLGPIGELIDSLSSIRESAKRFPATQRLWIENVKSDVSRIESNFYTFIDVKKARSEELDKTELGLAKAFFDTKTALNQILSTNTLFGSEILNPVITSVSTEDGKNSTYLNSIENSNKRAASKKKIENTFSNKMSIDIPSSVYSVVVQDNETLEDIAYRTTGSVAPWFEIALINDLVYPYIDPLTTRTDGRVKKPGDTVLVPSMRSDNILEVASSSRETMATFGLTPVEKFMGVDLKLNSDYDLILNNQGDYALIAGVANASQAIHLKIALEKGSLRYHPNIGISLDIGRKGTFAPNEIADNIRNSILLDDRFESVTDMTIARNGSTYSISMLVKIVDVKLPVPLTLKI